MVLFIFSKPDLILRVLLQPIYCLFWACFRANLMFKIHLTATTYWLDMWRLSTNHMPVFQSLNVIMYNNKIFTNKITFHYLHHVNTTHLLVLSGCYHIWSWCTEIVPELCHAGVYTCHSRVYRHSNNILLLPHWSLVLHCSRSFSRLLPSPGKTACFAKTENGYVRHAFCRIFCLNKNHCL